MSKKGKTNHKRSCQSFSFILITDYIHSKTSYMDKSPCLWKQIKWNTFLFYGDRLSGKMENYSRGSTSPDSVFEKITWEEERPLIRRQAVWRIYSDQMTEKQNSVKIAPSPQKNETTPVYGNRCSFDEKKKGGLYKVGMNRLESYKSGNLLLQMFIL